MLDAAQGLAMTPNALFNIASMTKAVTAVAALQLYEQGKLLIDDPVSKYFPKFGGMRVAVLDDKQQDDYRYRADNADRAARPDAPHLGSCVYGGRGTTPVHKQYPEGSGVAGATMTWTEFLDRLSSAPLYHQPGAAWIMAGLDVLGLVIE